MGGGGGTILLFPGSCSRICNFLENSFWNRGRYTPFDDVRPLPVGKREDNHFENTKKLLLLFKYSASLFNINMIFAIDPAKHSSTIMYDYNNTLRKIYPAMNLPFIDLDGVLADNNHLFYDDLHCNEEGSLFYGVTLAYSLINYLKIKSQNN